MNDELLQIAEAHYASRRSRDDALRPFGFRNGDVAWDILLFLFCMHRAHRRVVASDVYNAAAAPMSTAIRRLTELEQCGLTRRISDHRDRRRSFIELSEVGESSVAQALARLVR